jgi:hypothetical protein
MQESLATHCVRWHTASSHGAQTFDHGGLAGAVLAEYQGKRLHELDGLLVVGTE